MAKKLFINPNPHTVYIRDADGLEIPVEPWDRRFFFNNSNICLVVEGAFFEEAASRKQLEPIDAKEVGNVTVRGAHLEQATEILVEEKEEPEEQAEEQEEPEEQAEEDVEEQAEEPEEQAEEEDVEEQEEVKEKPRIDYTHFTKKQLKEMCNERNISDYGNKDDLIARLVNDDNGLID